MEDKCFLMKKKKGSTINQESLLPSCILVVNNQPFYITFIKALQLAFSTTLLKSTLGHCTFIPENTKTTCFTMKIDLKKLEMAFPPWSASKFPFFAVSFLSLLFILISQIRLLVPGCP